MGAVHINCIDFMTMMSGFKDFADCEYMKKYPGKITPVIYISAKDWITDRQRDQDGDYPKITLFDKYYEKLFLSKKKIKDEYGLSHTQYILLDKFIEPSVNIFNEVYFKKLLNDNELLILNDYFYWSYEYWGKEFKGIKLYHRPRGGIAHTGFDIGAM